MELTKILEYQEIDKELRKHELDIERSEDFKSAGIAKQTFEQARSAAQQTKVDGSKLLARFDKIKKYFEANSEKVDKLEKLLESGTIELDDLYEAGEQLERLQETFGKGESELGNYVKLVDEITQKYNDNYVLMLRNRKTFTESMDKYNKLKEEKEPLMNALKRKLADMEKDLPADLLDKYKLLRKDKIVPAFVKLDEGTRCGFCRMEQSKSRLSALTPDNLIECESCRRNIYTTPKTKK